MQQTPLPVEKTENFDFSEIPWQNTVSLLILNKKRACNMPL